MAYPRKRVSHGREAFYIFCILIALFVGVLSVVGPGGYLELKKAEADLETHQSRVKLLREYNAEKARTVDALTNNLDAVEAYARRKEYGKKGELVQEIQTTESQGNDTGNDKPGTGK
jgi:cell division protein FtsB